MVLPTEEVFLWGARTPATKDGHGELTAEELTQWNGKSRTGEVVAGTIGRTKVLKSPLTTADGYDRWGEMLGKALSGIGTEGPEGWKKGASRRRITLGW